MNPRDSPARLWDAIGGQQGTLPFSSSSPPSDRVLPGLLGPSVGVCRFRGAPSFTESPMQTETRRQKGGETKADRHNEAQINGDLS